MNRELRRRHTRGEHSKHKRFLVLKDPDNPAKDETVGHIFTTKRNPGDLRRDRRAKGKKAKESRRRNRA